MSQMQSFSSIYADVIDEFGWATNVKQDGANFHVSTKVFVLLTVAAEFFLITGMSFFSSRLTVPAGYTLSNTYIISTLCLTVAAMLLFNNNKLYKIEYIADRRAAILTALKVWCLVFVGLAILGFLTKTTDHISRVWVISWFTAGLFGITAMRVALGRIFALSVQRGYIVHKVVVVGAPDIAAAFIRKISGNHYGIRINAVFDDGMAEGYHGTVEDIPLHGSINSLLRYHKSHAIDTVVIASPVSDQDRLRGLIRQLSLQPLNVRIMPGQMALEPQGKWCAGFGELPGIHLMAITDLPIEGWRRLVKNLIDFTVAAVALVFFAPIMLGCIIGIKMSSPGPVFFMQKRIGYRNRVFSVYKFRSMHVSSCNTGKLTERNDPRIFKFGQIIRKLSLDELPQLLNVLKGDMSLVGPRPHMPEARAAGQFYFDLVSEYASRHRVKPGITGWAQVSGWRGPTETVEQIENRVRYDLDYIDNWSLTLDMVILVKTAFVGFFGKNAF